MAGMEDRGQWKKSEKEYHNNRKLFYPSQTFS